jgi:TolB-like protein
MKKFSIGFFLFLFAGVFVYSQQALTLDEAIAQAADRIERDIGSNKKIAVLNFISLSEGLSTYVIDELMDIFTNHRVLEVTERSRMDAILRERNYQTSGEVSDAEIQSIGNQLGANYVITGQLDYSGIAYRFRVYAIDIARGTRVASTSADIRGNDRQLAYFLGENQEGSNGSQRYASRKVALGVQAGGMLGLWTSMDDSWWDAYGIKGNNGVLGSLYGKYAFNSFLDIQIGLNIGFNNGVHFARESWDRENEETFDFKYTTLDIPVLPTLTLSPHQDVLFRMSAGPYISVPITDLEMTRSNYQYGTATHSDPINQIIFGIMGGVGIGYRIGKGNIVFDIRYLSDFMMISDEFTRRGLNFLLGYEYWF